METNIQKKKKIFDRRSVFFSLITLLLFAALFLYLAKIDHSLAGGTHVAQARGWDAAKMREFANRLKADGLTDQATQAYEEYLREGSVDTETRANVYYAAGEMLFQAKKYEEALSYFYKAEIANPDFSLKSELGSYIVACLENLGKALDAEYQLESRASLAGEDREKKASGELVARIGKREITMGEVNAQLEKLPPWLSEEFRKDETRKLEFLQNYVASELLYEKGRKLGLDKDPEVRKQVAEFQKEIITQKVVSREITSKVRIDPADVRNYYEAHKENYRTEPRLKFEHILLETKVKAEEILEKIKEGSQFSEIAEKESKDEKTNKDGGKVSAWVYQGSPTPFFDYDEEASGKLFELEKDAAPVIIESPKGFHVVRVTDKEAERQKSFSEVSRQVEFEYRKEKEARLSQELLGHLLETEEVGIYASKFLPKEEPPESPKESQEIKTDQGSSEPEDKNS